MAPHDPLQQVIDSRSMAPDTQVAIIQVQDVYATWRDHDRSVPVVFALAIGVAGQAMLQLWIIDHEGMLRPLDSDRYMLSVRKPAGIEI